MWSHFLIPVLLVAHGLFFTIDSALRSNGTKPLTFKAAVYEHVPFLPVADHAYTRKEAVEMMEKNLKVYGDQAKEAKRQGVQILVYPEDGIYGMFIKQRKSIRPFLEQIPDPKVTLWNPCKDPTRYEDTEVQRALSCMALTNGLYLVANMGDVVPCDVRLDPKCPDDGHYQYNTDVAFDPDGKLVAKYHKANLFYETQFDTPKPEVVYFDTPFGRFGLLVCFDLLFEKPAVTMVTEHNVTNIAFPTAWVDALPLLSAIGYHSSFARGLGVNFLAANIHLPTFGFHGSGLYTPNGMASFYYDDVLFSPGELLVSTLDILEIGAKGKTVVEDDDNIARPISKSVSEAGDEFQSALFQDLFTFQLLENSSGNLSVCQKNVCCSLNFALSHENQSSPDMFALGVFDGLHTYQGQYYFQICVVVRCANKNDRKSCGAPTKVSNTKFKSLKLWGHFQTRYVYPQVITSEDGKLLLSDRKSWSYRDTTLTSDGLDQPLVTASLFGRYYCRDDGRSTCRV